MRVLPAWRLWWAPGGSSPWRGPCPCRAPCPHPDVLPAAWRSRSAGPPSGSRHRWPGPRCRASTRPASRRSRFAPRRLLWRRADDRRSVVLLLSSLAAAAAAATAHSAGYRGAAALPRPPRTSAASIPPLESRLTSGVLFYAQLARAARQIRILPSLRGYISCVWCVWYSRIGAIKFAWTKLWIVWEYFVGMCEWYKYVRLLAALISTSMSFSLWISF